MTEGRLTVWTIACGSPLRCTRWPVARARAAVCGPGGGRGRVAAPARKQQHRAERPAPRNRGAVASRLPRARHGDAIPSVARTAARDRRGADRLRREPRRVAATRPHFLGYHQAIHLFGHLGQISMIRNLYRRTRGRSGFIPANPTYPKSEVQ